MLTTDFLIAVDQDASRAPVTWLRLQASTIRDGLGATTVELRLHALALLAKLEHLEQLAQTPLAEPHDTTYLAPALTIQSVLLTEAS